MIDNTTFTAWLDTYGEAWEKLDPDLIVKIFSDNALYYETPFASPFEGREGIHHYWMSNAVATQKDVSFHYDGLAIADRIGIAHWTAKFTLTSTGKEVEIDGYLTAEFNDELLCICFREWWHVKDS